MNLAAFNFDTLSTRARTERFNADSIYLRRSRTKPADGSAQHYVEVYMGLNVLAKIGCAVGDRIIVGVDGLNTQLAVLKAGDDDGYKLTASSGRGDTSTYAKVRLQVSKLASEFDVVDELKTTEARFAIRQAGVQPVLIIGVGMLRALA